MSMDIEKTFTGTAAPNFLSGKKYLLWLAAVWLVFIAWAVIESSLFPIIVISAFSAIALVARLPVFEYKTCIKISHGALSVHSKETLLWQTDLKDVISIELEEKNRVIAGGSNKALLIRNNKNDSYFLPLDGLVFDGLEADELVQALNAIRNSA